MICHDHNLCGVIGKRGENNFYSYFGYSFDLHKLINCALLLKSSALKIERKEIQLSFWDIVQGVYRA